MFYAATDNTARREAGWSLVGKRSRQPCGASSLSVVAATFAMTMMGSVPGNCWRVSPVVGPRFGEQSRTLDLVRWR